MNTRQNVNWYIPWTSVHETITTSTQTSNSPLNSMYELQPMCATLYLDKNIHIRGRRLITLIIGYTYTLVTSSEEYTKSFYEPPIITCTLSICTLVPRLKNCPTDLFPRSLDPRDMQWDRRWKLHFQEMKYTANYSGVYIIKYKSRIRLKRAHVQPFTIYVWNCSNGW